MKFAQLMLPVCLAFAATFAHAEAPADILSTPSHRPGLTLRILHQVPPHAGQQAPVLFIHGSSFPSELAFGFRIDGRSWMDVMAAQGFDTYALDFLGYGLSDRYPEMAAGGSSPVGRARDVQADVDRAVDFIRARTGQRKVTVIAHSWGGSVAALYAQEHGDKVASLVLFAAVTPRFDHTETPPAPVAQAANDMTPAERVRLMDGLRPSTQPHALVTEMFSTWGPRWLASDPTAATRKSASVRFPAGPDQDLNDLKAGRSDYDPTRIAVPTLLVRGEWDAYPSAADFAWLYGHLTSAPAKKSVTIPHGTHVMHLEQSRQDLYAAVLEFLASPVTAPGAAAGAAH